MAKKNNIDQWFEESLSGMTQKPSSQAWSRIDEQLDALSSASVDVDAAFEETLGDVSPQVNPEIWTNIESGLDYAFAADKQSKRRIAFWYSFAASIAAIFVYMLLQVKPYVPEEQYPAFQNNAENKVESTNLSTSNKNVDISLNQQQDVLGSSASKATIKLNQAKAKRANSNNNNILNNEIGGLNEQQPNQVDESSLVVIASKEKLDKENNNSEVSESKNNDFVMITEMIDPFSEPSSVLITESQSVLAPFEMKSLYAATGFSLDLFAGPEFIKNSHMNKPAEGSPVMIDNIAPTISAPSLGANVKFHYNRFFIQSGLTYSSYGEKNSYQTTSELHDTSDSHYTYGINTYHTYDTIGWIDDLFQPGVVVPHLSATLHTDTVSSTWNTIDSAYYMYKKDIAKNRYHYIEIPIMIGYQFEYKSWSLSTAGGLSYGFRVAQAGSYISDNQLKSIDNENSPYSNGVINGIVSIGLGYAITDEISLMVQPTYKTNLSELSASSVNYQSISLRLGVNIKL